MDSKAWDERYAATELVWSAGPNRFVVEEVEALPAGRALDVACGEGRNAIWLAERGWRTTGVDFSPAGIDKARRLAAGRHVDVEWVVADVTEYEPDRAAFDLVVMAYLQLPADELAAAVAHAIDALDAGGTLVVIGHATANLDGGYGGPQDATVLYEPDDVARLLTGVVVEKAQHVDRAVETADGTRHAIDTLVRARRA